jgi:ectoine hydroxylase
MYLAHGDVEKYHRDGYVLVENVFTPEEIHKFIAEVEGGSRVAGSTIKVADSSGKAAKLAIWFDLKDDIWSAASTCPRIVNNIRILLGQEAAFFHGKVMLKEARSGGAWEWHQDYGYWYDQGFLYPDMMSAFIALDPATRENGCLRVLRGSHKLGRLEHKRVGDQTGADPTRIQQIESMFELVECEMSPGSVLFFHSNLLHSSAPNESDKHRRSFIMCYNAWGNPQITKGEVVRREPCPVGKDDAILTINTTTG